MTINPKWPVLREYTGEHLKEIALPLGGIGTGTVSLGGRGDLRDFEVMQRPAKGFVPEFAFFAVAATDKTTRRTRTKLLEGPLDIRLNTSGGSALRWYGLPRFRTAEFHAAYPLAQVILTDQCFPLSVRAEVFNPLIPTDADASGYPVVAMRYVVENTSSGDLDVSIAGSLSNFIGYDGSKGASKANRNEFRNDADLAGIFFDSEGVDPLAPQYGTMALAITEPHEFSLTHRVSWLDPTARYLALIDFWRDFETDGRVDDRERGPKDDPVASLCATKPVAAGGTASWTFLLAWRFPNRYTWTPRKGQDSDQPENEAGAAARSGSTDTGPQTSEDERLGNYYARIGADAWEITAAFAQHADELERRTCAFVRAVVTSDLPPVVKEAALFNLPALRSQTSFRTTDGMFYGWEGCHDSEGSCYGSNPHVWNYEHATALLFGDLALNMREVELRHAMDETGVISYRVNLPLSRATEMAKTAADGQMGCVVKLYREWRLSGDDKLLKRLWHRAKAALEFAWKDGSWDADQDGVMEGVQHNTTDLEFLGPNPMMAGWYFAALSAGAAMARHMGDTSFAERCVALRSSGEAWVEENLWNGEYYVQDVRPFQEGLSPARGVSWSGFMSYGPGEYPGQQPGSGCMTDQLVGNYAARMIGLEDVFNSDRVRTALESIYRYNFVGPLWDYSNPTRAFAVNDEAMVVVGSYPDGIPENPCFRFFENWTGVEYAFATNLIFAGFTERAMQVIDAVRARFDGKKRNPFDEPEAGRHYARAMASWSPLVALTGFSYDGRSGRIRFAHPSGDETRWFFSTGRCWGTVSIARVDEHLHVRLRIGEGSIRVQTIEIRGFGETSIASARTMAKPDALEVTVVP